MKKLNKKGFTLVELLAVIVILALLMVVATRTVGVALSNSKAKAMQTEINKIVSKTYEEANAAKLLHTTLVADDFSYDIGARAAFASNILKGEEGGYKYNVTLNTSSDTTIVIAAICITDGSNGYNSSNSGSYASMSSSGNNVSFSQDKFDTTAVTACP